jgi:hypothetical protein
MKGSSAGSLLLIPFAIFSLLMAQNARNLSRTSSRATAERSSFSEKTISDAKRPAEKSAIPKASPAANRWVETTLRKMSVDEKIGQVLFATYHGSFTATDSAAYAQMMHDVDDLHVGWFITIRTHRRWGL